MDLFSKIEEQLPPWRERVNRLTKIYGNLKVCDVTVEQIYGGIRGVQIQVSDISYVDPMLGIRLRGYTIPELLEDLPKAPGSNYPLTGGLFYLLMVNEFPTQADAEMVEAEWKQRSVVPDYVYDVLRALPADTHPMTLFSTAILALQRESVFASDYAGGSVRKPDYWKGYLEDSLNLTAKVPALAAFIYNHRYRGGQVIDPDPNLDWSANFAHMIGIDDEEYKDLCRLFFFLHSDHEGGNVSAHASHLVASALSDVYYACSAGMNGLAGPLHGLANQECIRWLLGVRDQVGEHPTREQVEACVSRTLDEGQVIPGYGHAVLRTTDPRFTAQLDYGWRVMPDDDLFQLVNLVYDVVPDLLEKQGKVKNPYPNVDAINGTMQYHYGVKEFDYYTVLFGVSRILGLTTHAVWSRALQKPIERPKSLTTKMLEELITSAYFHRS